MGNKSRPLALVTGASTIGLLATLTGTPARADSLQQLIDARAKEDEEKVRLLNELE